MRLLLGAPRAQNNCSKDDVACVMRFQYGVKQSVILYTFSSFCFPQSCNPLCVSHEQITAGEFEISHEEEKRYFNIDRRSTTRSQELLKRTLQKKCYSIC